MKYRNIFGVIGVILFATSQHPRFDNLYGFIMWLAGIILVATWYTMGQKSSVAKG